MYQHRFEYFAAQPLLFADVKHSSIQSRFREAGFRVVPGAIVRQGAHIARGAVLMPSLDRKSVV